MKDKKLIIMVTIVILLTMLNVAYYGYIRISNIKAINKEEKEDQDVKGADLTQGDMEDLNKIISMYKQYYHGAIEMKRLEHSEKKVKNYDDKQQSKPASYKLNLHEMEN